MKSVLAVLLLVFAVNAFDLTRDDFFSLTPGERTELLYKLNPADRKQLADSMARWGAQEVIERADDVIKEYQIKLGELKSIVENSQPIIEKLASQVGLSWIIITLMF